MALKQYRTAWRASPPRRRRSGSHSFDGTPRSTFREPLPAGWDIAPEDLAEADPADIAGLLTTAPVAVDELIRQSGAGAAQVQMALLELEIAGRLERHAAGRVSLVG